MKKSYRKLLAVSLAVLAAFPMNISVPASADDKTIDIGSVAELVNFSEDCSLDSYSKGMTVNLTADIDLTGSNFITIPSFGGTFNGNNHTISGLNVRGTVEGNGLFIELQKDAVINNLILDVSIDSRNEDVVGGFVKNNSGTISACTIQSNIHGRNYVGGIAGINEKDGVIEDCVAKGTVNGMTYTGGVAGENDGIISGCKNEVNVNITDEGGSINSGSFENLDLKNLLSATNLPYASDTGGIAGYSTGIVQNCENNADIGYPHVGYNVGGIVGRQVGYLEKCTNNGKIYGRKDVGGICGQCIPSISLNFDNSNIATLRDELKKLEDLTNNIGDDADNAIGDLSSSMDKVSGYVSSAKSSADELASLVSDDAQKTVSSVNNAVLSLDDYAKKFNNITVGLTDVIKAYRDAGKEAKNSIKDIKITTEELESAVKEFAGNLITADAQLKNGISYLKQASELVSDDKLVSKLENIEEKQKSLDNELQKIKQAGNGETVRLKKVMAMIFEISGDILDAVKNINIKDITDKLKKGYSDASQVPSKALKYINLVSQAMESLKSGLAGTKEAITQFSSKLAKLDVNGASDGIKKSSESINSGNKKAETILSDLKNLKNEFENDDSIKPQVKLSDYSKSVQGLAAAIGGIGKAIDSTKKSLKNSSAKLKKDFDKVSSQFDSVMNTFTGMIDDTKNKDYTDKDTYIQDISDEEIFSATDGKTAECENNGMIEADVNVGGIAGTMAVEYDLDPEDDINVNGSNGMNFVYQSKVIIFNSNNKGKVISKKDCAGGIVGNMEVGTVYGCEAFGSIESKEGNYTGGIAGKSVSNITKCYSKCLLSGNDYVGGITGEGNNISGSYSIVEVEKANAYSGAVTGRADGKLEGNYFVSDVLSGVGMVSYKGKAEPISYQDFCANEDVPDEFKSMTATFIIDGKIVDTIDYEYGSSITEDKLPEIPAKEGCYGKWLPGNFNNLTFDVVEQAEYYEYLNVVSSSLKRNDSQSVIIAIGRFTYRSSMEVTEGTDGYSGADENYHVRITDGEDISNIRYLPKDDKDYSIYIKTTAGDWQEVSANKYGAYYTFECSEQEFDMSVVELSDSNIIMYVLLAVGTIVILFIINVIVKKISSLRKVKRKEESEC